MKTGIILFAHGSRDPLWHKPMEAVAAQIRATSPATAVLCAYLELSKPDLSSAIETLRQADVQHVKVVPMFLGVGKHAREDLPMLVADLQRLHPHLHIALQSPVSEDLRLIDLLARIALTEQ